MKRLPWRRPRRLSGSLAPGRQRAAAPCPSHCTLYFLLPPPRLSVALFVLLLPSPPLPSSRPRAAVRPSAPLPLGYPLPGAPALVLGAAPCGSRTPTHHKWAEQGSGPVTSQRHSNTPRL